MWRSAGRFLSIVGLCAGAHAQTFNGLPGPGGTNLLNSGRFINVTRGLQTLGDTGAQQVFNISIELPATVPNVLIEIFDGDMIGIDLGGRWDVALNPHDELNYRLYADPNLLGNTDAGNLVSERFSETMADNDWTELVNMAQDGRAYNAARDSYIYHLVAEWATNNFSDEQNNFKVRVANGTPFILPGSTIGFIGYGPDDPAPAVFPQTTYDGTLTVIAVIPDIGSVACRLDIYDGDADRVDDTDDPNTSTNLADLPFNVSTATLPERARPGLPQDDPATSNAFTIPPSVMYRVTGPNESYVVDNNNPSGNREWELFRIASSDPACTANPETDFTSTADVVVASLDPGAHEIKFHGLDGRNTIFLNSNFFLTAPPPGGGEGCTPGYWKNHLDRWVKYLPTDSYDNVFGVDAFGAAELTLLEALVQGGGGEMALGRHAVAALLNATSGGQVDYAFAEEDVISIVRAAYMSGDFESAKNQLANENEMGCPIDGKSRKKHKHSRKHKHHDDSSSDDDSSSEDDSSWDDDSRSDEHKYGRKTHKSYKDKGWFWK